MASRPLSERELAVLEMLLPDSAFPDVGVYKEQASAAEVVATCPCGCATIDLRIDERNAQRASFVGDPLLPVEAQTRDQDEPRELILFAPDGWLTSLEIVYYSGEPPASFPAPEDCETFNKRDLLE